MDVFFKNNLITHSANDCATTSRGARHTKLMAGRTTGEYIAGLIWSQSHTSQHRELIGSSTDLVNIGAKLLFESIAYYLLVRASSSLLYGYRTYPDLSLLQEHVIADIIDLDFSPLKLVARLLQESRVQRSFFSARYRPYTTEAYVTYEASAAGMKQVIIAKCRGIFSRSFQSACRLPMVVTQDSQVPGKMTDMAAFMAILLLAKKRLHDFYAVRKCWSEFHRYIKRNLVEDLVGCINKYTETLLLIHPATFSHYCNSRWPTFTITASSYDHYLGALREVPSPALDRQTSYSPDRLLRLPVLPPSTYPLVLEKYEVIVQHPPISHLEMGTLTFEYKGLTDRAKYLHHQFRISGRYGTAYYKYLHCIAANSRKRPERCMCLADGAATLTAMLASLESTVEIFYNSLHPASNFSEQLWAVYVPEALKRSHILPKCESTIRHSIIGPNDLTKYATLENIYNLCKDRPWDIVTCDAESSSTWSAKYILQLWRTPLLLAYLLGSPHVKCYIKVLEGVKGIPGLLINLGLVFFSKLKVMRPLHSSPSSDEVIYCFSRRASTGRRLADFLLSGQQWEEIVGLSGHPYRSVSYRDLPTNPILGRSCSRTMECLITFGYQMHGFQLSESLFHLTGGRVSKRGDLYDLWKSTVDAMSVAVRQFQDDPTLQFFHNRRLQPQTALEVPLNTNLILVVDQHCSLMLRLEALQVLLRCILRGTPANERVNLSIDKLESVFYLEGYPPYSYQLLPKDVTASGRLLCRISGIYEYAQLLELPTKKKDLDLGDSEDETLRL
jgi:hypothetical protein